MSNPRHGRSNHDYCRVVNTSLAELRAYPRILAQLTGFVTENRRVLDTPTLVSEVVNAPGLVIGASCLGFGTVSFVGVLHNITATAKPNTVVAIVGPNGAKKLTLLSLAARLIDPYQGTIRLDGPRFSHTQPYVGAALDWNGKP